MAGLRGPLPLKRLQDWVFPGKIAGKDALALLAANEEIRVQSAKNPDAWREALKHKDPQVRRAAVYRAGARGAAAKQANCEAASALCHGYAISFDCRGTADCDDSGLRLLDRPR